MCILCRKQSAISLPSNRIQWSQIKPVRSFFFANNVQELYFYLLIFIFVKKKRSKVVSNENQSIFFFALTLWSKNKKGKTSQVSISIDIISWTRPCIRNHSYNSMHRQEGPFVKKMQLLWDLALMQSEKMFRKKFYLKRCKISEYFVGRREASNPIFIVNYLPVPEAHLLLFLLLSLGGPVVVPHHHRRRILWPLAALLLLGLQTGLTADPCRQGHN